MAGSGSKPQYAVALTLRFLVLTVSGVALLGFGGEEKDDGREDMLVPRPLLW